VPPKPALIDDLLTKRVVVLTGKGGVGKSTSSAALALIASQRGMRVLLVEVDAKGNLPDFFDARRVGFKPTRLHKDVHGLSMQPKESMQEYLHLYLRLPSFSLRPLEGFIGYTSNAIPGLKEILVTGKIFWEERALDVDGQPRWDLVIVDGAPTGHAVSQLGAARHISELVRTGPIHDQAVQIADLLSDPDRTSIVLVTIPEEMPVNETIDLNRRFEEETDIRPQGLIINQLQPETVPESRLAEFRALVKGEGRGGFLAEYPEGDPLLLAGNIFLEARARAEHASRLLNRTLRLPTLTVPFVFQRHHGFAFTRALARSMVVS
jgi:anion-transporting  ArsA/GET3 family ATPase